jgi:hypothetical protein
VTAHEDGAHVHGLVKGCEGCERERPAIQRLQEQVRYIVGGKTIQPPKGWRAIEPPGPIDFEAISAQVEEEAWDLGPDEEP